MLRRLLGAVFSRWTLLVLLLAALLAIVWHVGPMVSIGGDGPLDPGLRPLDSERSRWIATAAILATAAAVFGWRRWRARRGNAQIVAQLAAAPPAAGADAESDDLRAVRERFEAALAQLGRRRFRAARPGLVDGAGERARGAAARLGRRLVDRLSGRYLYELPWYLIIGAPGTGKTTALRNAGLEFPLAEQLGDQVLRGVGGTRDCDWWFTDRAVLIDTAGRFTTQDSDRERDRATWGGFLALLKRARPRQPVNGVIVAVAVPDLIARSESERTAQALAVRARLQELHEALRIRFPVYLLVTKADLMAGFTDTFATLDKAQRAAPWGVTFDTAPRAWAQALPRELDALLARLDAGLVDRVQAEADPLRRARIYGLPNQFAALREPLAAFVARVFAASPHEADPMLRGVYFVSGTQEGSPIDRVLGAVARRFGLEQAMLPPLRAGGRSYFLEGLLDGVIFAEQDLGGTSRAAEARQRAWQGVGWAALAVVAIGVAAAWTASWRANRDHIAAVAGEAERIERVVGETPNRPTPDVVALLPALDAMRALAGRGAAAPATAGFGLSQAAALDGAARAAYERMLRDALLPRLALRFEEQLRRPGAGEAQYEALKAYLMMYEPRRFDAKALKAQVEADWDATLARAIAPEQRAALGVHLDELLALGPAVSPLPRDQALVDAVRARLTAVGLPQRVWARLRQSGLGAEYPEFSVAKASKVGPSAGLVFVRASGQPLTRGVPGLFTFRGYHEGFQKRVAETTRLLADEQPWVLGVPAAPAVEAGSSATGVRLTFGSERLVDEVRRLYLTDYRDEWKAFIADLRMIPAAGITQAIDRTRVLAAADGPLLPLLRAISHETTLAPVASAAGAAPPSAIDRAARAASEAVGRARDLALGKAGVAVTPSRPVGLPGERIESIVDDEFAPLRRYVTAPPGGKAPVDEAIAQLAQLQQQLSAAKAALDGGTAPPPSPLAKQIKDGAVAAPEPLKGVLETLGAAGAQVVALQLRDVLGRDVRSKVGEFCRQATAGRYPFDASATREVTPKDFADLFGPGGRFEQLEKELSPSYIDTTTRPWSFRVVNGVPLGRDTGSLPQLQRAAAIRETFFVGGQGPAMALTFKPVEMDPKLTEITIDIDGQIVRYDHGPTNPQPVRWPGPRNSGVVRMMAQPAGATGMVAEGPWALMRLFERVSLVPGGAPEKFRATFDVDGRKAVFDITAASVRNPLRMPELRAFSCPVGL